MRGDDVTMTSLSQVKGMLSMKDTPLSSLLVHDSVATFTAPDGITWSDLILTMTLCMNNTAYFLCTSSFTKWSKPPQMYIIGCLVEVAVVGAPGPGVAPPVGVPMSAILIQVDSSKFKHVLVIVRMR